MNINTLAEIINRPLVKEAAIMAVDDYLEFVKARAQEFVDAEPNALNEYEVVGVPITSINRERLSIDHDPSMKTFNCDLVRDGLYRAYTETYKGFDPCGYTDDLVFFKFVIEELISRGFSVVVTTNDVEHGFTWDIVPQILLYARDDTTGDADKVTARSIVDIFEEPQKKAKIEEAARIAVEKYLNECSERFEEFIEDQFITPKNVTAVGLSIVGVSFGRSEIVTGELENSFMEICFDEKVYSREQRVLKFAVNRDSEMFLEAVLKKLEDEGFDLTVEISKDRLIPWVYANKDYSDDESKS